MILRRSRRSTASAFTRKELVVVLLVLGAGVAALMLAQGLHRSSKARADCKDQLRQIGIAFRTWPKYNTSAYPMKVAVVEGGTMELAGGGHAFVHFRAMSNELNTTKVLVCTADKTKTLARSFTNDLSDANVSYFVGTDSQDTFPQTFLSGDRHLAHNGQPLKPGLFVLTSNNASGLSWTADLHGGVGNVLLGDGSVHFMKADRLIEAAKYQDMETNRLAVP